ncbi:antibiotic biosynthesis monooxygenase [Ruminococcaceae bacterium OttesenSCG-928-I18]|nr:antibiotic biosynthesis monooxygenase [Ruminococcaceae bacterium OttesenSCG-928-I18]
MDMIRVVAQFELKPGNLDKAVEVATELVGETRKEEGCEQYDFFKSSKDENHLVLLERWRSQEDLDKHFKLPHFVELVPKLGELCVKAPVIETVDPLF